MGRDAGEFLQRNRKNRMNVLQNGDAMQTLADEAILSPASVSSRARLCPQLASPGRRTTPVDLFESSGKVKDIYESAAVRYFSYRTAGVGQQVCGNLKSLAIELAHRSSEPVLPADFQQLLPGDTDAAGNICKL